MFAHPGLILAIVQHVRLGHFGCSQSDLNGRKSCPDTSCLYAIAAKNPETFGNIHRLVGKGKDCTVLNKAVVW